MTVVLLNARHVPALMKFYKNQGGVNALYFADAIAAGFIRAVDDAGNLVDVPLED